MKKIISIVLIVSMLFALCGCGDESSANDSSSKSDEQTKVELTVDNVEEYLEINCEYVNATREQNVVGQWLKESDIKIETYAITSGSFENVEITLRFDLSSSDKDENYHVQGNESLHTLESKFKVKANGDHDEVIGRMRCFSYINLDVKSGNAPYEIVSVSGTFVKN
ncbi:MAG: hypothetical protein MJ108_09230 [Saccharofermentans sp.]|nr:hypothetical protein [Saccharofermentans sp.]